MKTLVAWIALLAGPAAHAGDLFSLVGFDPDFDSQLGYLYVGASYRDDSDPYVASTPFELTYVGERNPYAKRTSDGEKILTDQHNAQWQFSLAGDLYVSRKENGQEWSGFGDLMASATYVFRNDNQRFLSLEAGAVLPTGSRGITSDSTDAFAEIRYQTGPLAQRIELSLLALYTEEPLQSGGDRTFYRGSAGVRLDVGYGRWAFDALTALYDGDADVALSASFAKRIGTQSYLYLNVRQGVTDDFDSTYCEAGIQVPLRL